LESDSSLLDVVLVAGEKLLAVWGLQMEHFGSQIAVPAGLNLIGCQRLGYSLSLIS
jgi:hypothetical protein